MEGLINGIYHVQFTKEEIEAIREAVKFFICITTDKENKKLTKTLINLVPKITP